MSHQQIKTNISVLVGADVVAKLLPLLTFPFITRVLGPEMYGKYGFAMGVAGFFMLLASPGFTTFGIRAVAQRPGEEKRLASKITGLRLLFSFVAFLALGGYTLAWAPQDTEARLLILVASLVIIPNAVNLDWLLTGASKIVPVAVSNIISQLVYTAAVFLLLWSAKMAWVVPIAAFAGAVVGLLISYYYVWRRFGLAWPSASVRDFREIVPPSLLLGFASLMSMTYDKIDAIILGYFRPMEEVGVYTATYRLMWMVMSFLPILSTVFFPLIAKAVGKDPKVGKQESELYLKFLFLAALPLIAGGILLAEPLATFVIGKEYAGSGLLFSLLLPNVLLGGLAIYYAGMRLVALNRNREYVIAVSAGALLNVGLNLIVIPVWGSIGAALTTCLSQAAVAGVGAWYGRDDQGPRLVPAAVVPSIASVCMVISLALAMSLLPGLDVLILVLIGAVAYGLGWEAARRRRWMWSTST